MLCIKKDHKGADGNLVIMKKLFTDYGFLYEIEINPTIEVCFHVYLFTICIKYSFIESIYCIWSGTAF